MKHLKEEHQFFIEGAPSPSIEQSVLGLVDEFVLIYPKYMNKGHTKQSELKQVEKHVSVTVTERGVAVKLNVHVHHYSKVYFNIFEYMAKLNAELKLPPASIKYGQVSEPVDIPKPKLVRQRQTGSGMIT